MNRADADALAALLVEIEGLAMSARRCIEHTRYHSDDAVAMKKYHRTDADVAAWLDRLSATVARVDTLRARVASLASAREDRAS